MTNWRDYGPVEYPVWANTILDAGGPPELSTVAAWQAAGEHSALALAMLNAESSYGKNFNLNKKENLNPLNLRPPSGGGYMAYPTYPAAIRAWRERLTSPDYKGGVYANTETLEDLIHVYAPGSDNNDEAAYVATIRTLFLAWGIKGEPPMADIVFGKVPYPDVIQSHLPASNPYVQEGGAPKDEDVEAVFWHIMVGTWAGTNSWFHAGKAATAYGVSVQSVDGVGGKIYEWIPRNNGWYGESSGPAVAPYGDGAKLIAKVGVNSVNRTTKAIEISGNPSTPLDPASRLSIVKITAYYADKHRIPWNEFPIVPGEDRSYVCWHNEITGLAYKTCPGTVVMGETPALIVQVANYLKQFQQPGAVIVTPPVYAASELPEWWEETVKQSYPGDQSENGTKFYVCRRNFVAKTGTRRLNKPGENPERSGPNLKQAEKVHGERYCVVGKERRILTNDGHYIAANKLSPPVKVG
jgi:hypothetical protein